MNNDQSRLKRFLNENNLPSEIERNLKKQVRDRPRFEVNTGSDKKPYGVTKSFFEQIVADENTAILAKSYDFIEEKKNPEEDDKVSLPKFEIMYSLGEYIRRFYDLPERKEEKLQAWIEDGVPKKYILQELPDDGAKFNRMKNRAKGEPNLSVYQFLNSEWIKDKEHIVWEENPHQPYTQNVDMSPIKDKNKFNWNESDVEDILDVDKDVQSQQGILNKIVEYDLHKKVDDGVLHMFLHTIKNLQEDLKTYEAEVDNDEVEVGEHCVKEHFNGREYIWQIPKTPKDFWGEYTTQDGDIKQPFSIMLNTLKPHIYDKMEEQAERGDMYSVRELSKVLDNLQSLTLLAKLEFRMTINWCRGDMLGKKSVNKGVSPFSMDGNGEGKGAYITFHRQYLEILDDVSRENDIKVTVCYANADMKEDGLIKSRVDDAQEHSIELEGSLKTTVHHIEQSFAKTRTTRQKQKAVESMKKLLEQRGKKVGIVSYMNWGYGEDIPLGNSKGREFPFDADVGMVVGTPRKNDWQYAVKHLLLHKKFPRSGVYNEETSNYEFPKEEIERGFSIEGYKEDSLDAVYRHSVLDEKTDAVFRLRKQMDRKKDIIIFDQCPPNVREIYRNCKWKSYENYQRFFRRELLPKFVVRDTKDDEIELPYITEELPRGLWRDGSVLKKTQNNYDEIEELVFKEVVMDQSELEDEVGCTGKTIKNNSKKNDNLVWISGGGRGNPSRVQRSFKLRDFF